MVPTVKGRTHETGRCPPGIVQIEPNPLFARSDPPLAPLPRFPDLGNLNKKLRVSLRLIRTLRRTRWS